MTDFKRLSSFRENARHLLSVQRIENDGGTAAFFRKAGRCHS